MSTTKEQGIENMTVQVPWKAIVLFSIPLFIGGLFQQFYSMADAIIIGRLLGVKELAGVGATGAMSFLVIGFATGLTSGFAVLTAQRAGTGDIERVKASIAVSFFLCGGIAGILTVLSMITAGPLLTFMNTPEDIFPFAYRYILIIYAGLGVTIYNNMIAGILRAIGDSRTPLFFLTISSVLNILFDLVAILSFHAGVMGAASATVLAQLISAMFCFLYAIKRYPQIRLEKRHFERLISKIWSHMRIGLPMALQFSVTAVGIMILQAYLNQFGSLVIAGYTAASKIEELVTQPFIALSITMEVYCAQNYGAGNKNRIRQGIRSSLCIGMAAVVIASCLNLFLGRKMIALFLEKYDFRIVEYGYHYLMVIAFFFWLLCALQIIRSSSQGMGEALVPMICGIIELLSRWGGCVLLTETAGYIGVYLTTPMAWGLALTLLLTRYVWIISRESDMPICRKLDHILK